MRSLPAYSSARYSPARYSPHFFPPEGSLAPFAMLLGVAAAPAAMVVSTMASGTPDVKADYVNLLILGAIFGVAGVAIGALLAYRYQLRAWRNTFPLGRYAPLANRASASWRRIENLSEHALLKDVEAVRAAKEDAFTSLSTLFSSLAELEKRRYSKEHDGISFDDSALLAPFEAQADALSELADELKLLLTEEESKQAANLRLQQLSLDAALQVESLRSSTLEIGAFRQRVTESRLELEDFVRAKTLLPETDREELR